MIGDLDEASVVAARAIAEQEGDPELAGRYDLALAFECIHYMSDPVGVLSAMRRLTSGGGTVLVADKKVADFYHLTG